MTQINILRQYPADSHDTPIKAIAARSGYELSQFEYEASPNPAGIPRNLYFLLRELIFSTGDIIVLGAEPYDKRIPLFDRLANHHNVILHTSWPYWMTDNVPQPTSVSPIRNQWRSFLAKSHAVGVTRAAAKSVAKAGAKDATHIPHAVNTSVFNPSAGRPEDRREPPVILFVGRLERRKGIRDLLHVVDHWEGQDIVFRFVGAGPLSKEIESRSESDSVEFAGYVGDVEELASLYATSDVLVLPSYSVDGWEELFGIVIIEALASGLPVVATDCTGPKDVLSEGETGFIVPQRDPSVLHEHLRRLIEDRSLQRAMSENARDVATTKYDSEQVAKQWKSLIDQMGQH